MADQSPTEEEDFEWLTEAAESIEKGAEQNIEWFFQKMDGRKAFARALNYKVGSAILKDKQEREMFERKWQRRVGTTFPGWKESELYALAGWAGIPGGDVIDLSPYQLYDRAMDAIAGPEQPAKSFLIGRHDNEVPDGDWQQLQSEIPDGDQQGQDEPIAEHRQASVGVDTGKGWTEASLGEAMAGNANKVGAALEALLGDESRKILIIARSDENADEKMRAICGIDRRCLAWNSPLWANLLDVSDAAIRKTQFWRVDRPQAIEAGRWVVDHSALDQ
jgi:hypothetical protein